MPYKQFSIEENSNRSIERAFISQCSLKKAKRSYLLSPNAFAKAEKGAKTEIVDLLSKNKHYTLQKLIKKAIFFGLNSVSSV